MNVAEEAGNSARRQLRQQANVTSARVGCGYLILSYLITQTKSMVGRPRKKVSDGSSRSSNLRVEVNTYGPGTLSIAPRRCDMGAMYQAHVFNESHSPLVHVAIVIHRLPLSIYIIHILSIYRFPLSLSHKPPHIFLSTTDSCLAFLDSLFSYGDRDFQVDRWRVTEIR